MVRPCWRMGSVRGRITDTVDRLGEGRGGERREKREEERNKEKKDARRKEKEDSMPKRKDESP